MESLVLVVIVAAIVAAVVKYRSQVSKERNEVLARMRTEHEVRGDYSPTAELFREAGAPLQQVAAFNVVPPPAPGSPSPAPVAAVAPTATLADPVSTHSDDTVAADAASDLAAMFLGIRMPAGLAPLGEMSPVLVTFVSSASARDVQPALAAELERIGAEVIWAEPTVAQVRRRGRLAALTVYPRPDLAVDLDGARLFPHAPVDSCVVRLALV